MWAGGAAGYIAVIVMKHDLHAGKTDVWKISQAVG